MTTWCILRCSGRSTLTLADSLSREGFTTWAPVAVRRVRVPRMNARRIVTEPLMKEYVFADYERRHELLALSDRSRRHADFSVVRDPFKFGLIDDVAKILDCALDGLRWIEARENVPTAKAERVIPEGVSVRVSSGLFSGMTGTVRRSKRGLTLVCFNDRYSAEIPTSLLSADDAYRLQAATQLAA